ncbi:MAG: DUF4838 domain-containing protein [Verrucomicrobia bacterium]|jgi:hypothetical protein|nr:DUF4838 domain-containing protein [Verrucomicrobiota bacterium]
MYRSITIILLGLAVWLPLVGQETIILRPRVDASVEAAAADLADVIELRTGQRPALRRSRVAHPERAIFLGDVPAARSALHLPHELSAFGSVYRRARGERIYLRAKNTEALVQGIYRLAYTEYGARWFFPGADTLFLSAMHSDRATATRLPVMQEPAFQQRQLGARRQPFSRWNGVNQPYRFNHALANVFTPGLFADHPELFARRGDGRIYAPTGSRRYDAQPHLALPAVADRAAEAALAYFEAHPEARSFSLATNDNIRFDESAATRALVEPMTYFRGLPNYSDLVFTFMNRAAERVFDEAGAWSTPDGQPRYLTALAYYWAEAVPSFPLHPRVLPVLTADRAQWRDPAYRAEDKALIEAWSESGAERIGTWDYYYGAPYPYPRQFNRWIIESIRHLAANGVDVFYSSLPVLFAYDGPKAYLAAQLLWDPWQDAEALLDEFYEGVFGPAATDMRDFYESFEAAHTAKGGPGQWIKFYMDEAGIGQFSMEFLEAMDALLVEAHRAAAGHPEVQARIEVVRRDFEITLIYARLQAARRAITTGLEGQPDAAMLAAVQSFTQARATLRKKLEPLYAIDRYQRNFRLLQAGSQSDPIPAALGALARSGSGVDAERMQAHLSERQYATVQRLRSSLMESLDRPVNPNPELWQSAGRDTGRYLFPQPMPQIRGWNIDLRPSEDLQLAVADPVLDQGLRITGADMVSFFSDLPVQSEQSYLLQTAVSFRASPDNRTRLELIWYDSDGKPLRTERPYQAPVDWEGKGAARTVNLFLPTKAPENSVRVRIRFSASRQYAGDFLEVKQVALYRAGGRTIER